MRRLVPIDASFQVMEQLFKMERYFDFPPGGKSSVRSADQIFILN
jgi:hypothetical protein